MKLVVVLLLLSTQIWARSYKPGSCDIFICDLDVRKSSDAWLESNIEIREPCQSCISSSEIHKGDFVFKIEMPNEQMLKMDLRYRGRQLMAFGAPRGVSDVNFETEVGTIKCHNKSIDLKANQERLEMIVENMLAEPEAYSKGQFIAVKDEILSHISDGGEFNSLLLSLFLKTVKDLRN